MTHNKKRVTLSDIKKEAPFQVPEGYFDSFSEVLKDRVREEHSTRAKTGLLDWLVHLTPSWLKWKTANLGRALIIFIMLSSFITILSLPFGQTYNRYYYAGTPVPDTLHNNLYAEYCKEMLSECQFLAIMDEWRTQQQEFASADLEKYISLNFSDYEIIWE